MRQFSEEWRAHRRARFMRPDAARWLRPDQAKYDPNQPRVPAGNPGGGQWTSGGGGPSVGGAPAYAPEVVHDRSGEQPWERVVNEFSASGSLAQQTVFNRDGSAIRSELEPPSGEAWDERHTVRLAEGAIFTFENVGATQIVRDSNGQAVTASVWTDDGPEPEATLQPAVFAPAWPLAPAIGPAVGALAGTAAAAAVTLYNWLSTQNSAGEAAVLAFRAEEFRPDQAGAIEASWVGQLSRSDTERACPRLDEIQARTDRVVSETSRSEFPDPARYGTEIHKKLAREINALHDPDLKAEVSLLKTKDETGQLPSYGDLDTVRIDVLENTRSGTICVYDIKTGRRGLTLGRVLEIMKAAHLYDPTATRIIVIEVRPSR